MLYKKVLVLAPKIQLFIWRLLKNGLAVTGNLSKHIPGINDECRLCNKATETMEQFFLHCEASQAVLFASPMSLRTSMNPSITVKDYLASWLNEGGEYMKFKMGTCLYWDLWKARNNIIFNGGKFSIQGTLKEAMYWYNMQLSTDVYEVIPTEKDILQDEKDLWEPPPDNKVKINFDGAAGSKGYACSAVARDNTANFKGGPNKVLNFISAVEAETHGAHLAVDLDICKGLNDVIIDEDSLIIMNSLRYRHYQYPWRIQNYISRIKDNLHNFNSVIFRFVRNTANKVAHELAAHAATNQSSRIWLNFSPSCITQLIELEASLLA
ncbi:uncharacterized protein LOC113305559 [Papaver somniferum]|uniref:uncharacterized protein LOC113305559 n=1 Tax=Papaver somniferum TaxID=3469 RepID=UPI000E6F8927|nr:uncharacterized protein LOC113305559 [Papaver somniferum]